MNKMKGEKANLAERQGVVLHTYSPRVLFYFKYFYLFIPWKRHTQKKREWKRQAHWAVSVCCSPAQPQPGMDVCVYLVHSRRPRDRNSGPSPGSSGALPLYHDCPQFRFNVTVVTLICIYLTKLIFMHKRNFSDYFIEHFSLVISFSFSKYTVLEP